ncbi:MAG: lytic transglycosylase domain-containing protein [Thermoanaerobaculia bacterium]|nr:lytic transglycosylase domain-containing protein [Thermoanaerobaculia bacterium]
MKKLNTTLWLAAPLAALAIMGLPEAPSSAVLLDAPPPPTAEEIRLVEELATWVHGDDSPGFGFDMEPSADFGDSVTHRRRSFDLFRSFNQVEEHSRILDDLPYGSLIAATAQDVRVDGLLVAAVVAAESGFNPRIVSSQGALGLMQLMPSTAAQYGVLDPMNPSANLKAGTMYLRDLLEQFDGELVLALAAYNAGPGNVRRYDGVPPFVETQQYVERVLSNYIGYHRSLWHETDVADLLERVDTPGTLALVESTSVGVAETGSVVEALPEPLFR